MIAQRKISLLHFLKPWKLKIWLESFYIVLCKINLTVSTDNESNNMKKSNSESHLRVIDFFDFLLPNKSAGNEVVKYFTST